MPCANRHYLPGYVWHLTHRCHRRQFLLRFARDRWAWLHWLYAARKRHGLCVLDYTVTCNHIHLLVRDQGRGAIARSMQLIAGRTGQEYNRRKRRRGAFWEDRYHATAVETGAHLAACLTYIDLNMVRAGVVSHPAQWPAGGYQEIQVAPQRYRIIDRAALADALGVDVSRLATTHADWVATALRLGEHPRVPEWSASLAVGSETFVARMAAELGVRAQHREIARCAQFSVLRDPRAPYGGDFGFESVPVSTEEALPFGGER